MSDITRDDAFLIVDKWRTERALLLCTVDFELGRVRKVGRVLGRSTEGILLRSDDDLPDGADDFTLIFPPEAAYLYGEPLQTEAASLEVRSTLIVLADIDHRETNKFSLNELIEPSRS